MEGNDCYVDEEGFVRSTKENLIEELNDGREEKARKMRVNKPTLDLILKNKADIDFSKSIKYASESGISKSLVNLALPVQEGRNV